MVVLSRDERRRRVLEFHNQNMGTREIAKLLHISFTDITKILKEADKEKEIEQQRTRQEFLASQAYKKFSGGKSLVQVAIELNIRASEAIILQREYWELAGLHDLDEIYEETKANPWPLINLYKSIRAEGMGVTHVINLLAIANNDLPGVEQRYNYLKQEVKSLQGQRTNLYNQVIEESSNLEYYRVHGQKEIERFEALQERRKKIEDLVTQFENHNSEYTKIERTVEETLRNKLFNRRWLLRLAALCITESIRENPEKYRYLVHKKDEPSDFNPFWIYGGPYFQPQHQQHNQPKFYLIEDYVTMLSEDSDKLMEKLVKQLGDEIINNDTTSDSPQPSLLSLPSDME